jgi:hypothetical protein
MPKSSCDSAGPGGMELNFGSLCVTGRSTLAVPASWSDRSRNGHGPQSRSLTIATRGEGRQVDWSWRKKGSAFAAAASNAKPKYSLSGSLQCPDFPSAQ